MSCCLSDLLQTSPSIPVHGTLKRANFARLRHFEASIVSEVLSTTAVESWVRTTSSALHKIS